MSKLQDSTKKDKEKAIFSAALKIIKQNGFHRARMSDVAREAGISYGLVYHYFKSKEDIFDAILNRWWEGLFRLMADINEKKNGVREKLGGIILYFFDTYQTNSELVNIFITEISRSTANLTDRRLKHFKEFMTLIEKLMKEGQDKGAFRSDFDARYLTYIFLGSIETFLSVMVLEDQKIKGDSQKKKIAESILEVFLNGAKKQEKGN